MSALREAPVEPAGLVAPPEVRREALLVVPSPTQMYSGLGRHLRRLVGVLGAEAPGLTVVTDDRDPRCAGALARASAQAGAALRVLSGYPEEDTLDPAVPALASLAGGTKAERLLLVLNGWANAWAIEEVCGIREAHAGCRLAFFPHYQPPSSVPMSPAQRERVSTALARVADVADLVIHDSAAEAKAWDASGLSARDSRVCLLGGYLDPQDLTAPVEAATRPARRAAPASRRRGSEVLMVVDLNEWHRKGMDIVERLALRAALERASGRERVRFVVVGTEPRSALRARRCRLLGAAGVRFRGYLSEAELYQAYREADVYLMCSREEAYCLPVVEALSAGCPVVARPIGIAPEVVVPGRNGVLCEGEDPARWWRAIMEGLRLARTADPAQISASVGEYREENARAALAQALGPLLVVA